MKRLKADRFFNRLMCTLVLFGISGVASKVHAEGASFTWPGTDELCSKIKARSDVQEKIQNQIDAQTKKMFNHQLPCEVKLRPSFNETLKGLVNAEFVPFCEKKGPGILANVSKRMASKLTGIFKKDEREKLKVEFEEAFKEEILTAVKEQYAYGGSNSVFKSKPVNQ